MSSIKVHDDDDDDDESSHQVKDLYVVVSDPEKHAGGYVSYNVNTKVKDFVFFHYALSVVPRGLETDSH